MWTLSPFVIRYVGTINNNRNAHEILEAMRIMDETHVYLDIVGDVPQDVKDKCLKYQEFGVSYYPKVDHRTAIGYMLGASVLLLIINDGSAVNVRAIVTGKLFEYLGAQKPILCLRNLPCEAEEYIEKYNLGWICNNERWAIIQTLHKIILKYELYEKQKIKKTNDKILRHF